MISVYLPDCCVIGNVSTLGVGVWGFKSLQSDSFIYFNLYIYFIINIDYYYLYILFFICLN